MQNETHRLPFILFYFFAKFDLMISYIESCTVVQWNYRDDADYAEVKGAEKVEKHMK